MVTTASAPLARHARQLVVARVFKALQKAVRDVDARFDAPPERAMSPAEHQRHDEMRLLWRQGGPAWIEASRQVLARPATSGDSTRSGVEGLQLVDETQIEQQILAGRLALAMEAQAQWEFNDLRLRLQSLEPGSDAARVDRIHAKVLAQQVVEAWAEAGLNRDLWAYARNDIEGLLPLAYEEGCHQANAHLLEQGVLPHIDLRALVRRTASDPARPAVAPPPGGGAGAGSVGGGHGQPRTPGGAAEAGSSGGSVARAATGAPARGAATEVTERLRQFLSQRVPAVGRWLGGGSPPAQATSVATVPAGVGAVTAAGATYESTQVLFAAAGPAPEWTDLAQGVAGVRQQTRALKAAARSDSDKAVIEVVALIFDSILAEERIPPSVRVWFARLQMPVLRVAVVDQDFLGAMDHPARQLIDRMGSCVLGFDPGVSMAPLEAEIKRVVQVIEQYPETGRRVFELVLGEFQQFLRDHLMGQGDVSRVASLAQQVEQKETLAVKFTIELRRLLGDTPVREPVRAFLFKVWVEVMAVASVRYGAQHPDSMALRQAAADVLWMADAKPTREERAQVIARLPALLAQLRDGMTLLGLQPAAQESHIERLSDALAEAFTSRGDPLSQDWLAGITSHLGRLESFLSDDEPDRLELDQDNIEWITGVDASRITVVPDTAAAMRPALKAWAAELPLGAWFELDHNGHASVVQLAWKSQRGQLFLFVASDQGCFLVQQGRVAQYLDAGLLKPREAESLTVRATRDALNKLDANPERLLA